MTKPSDAEAVPSRPSPHEAGPARPWSGPILVLASALLFSLSGVLTKRIEAGTWTILGWRGVVGGGWIAGYVWYRKRDRPVREVFRLGWQGWLLATVGGVGSISFIVAFKNTFVANVSVIYATIPFVAAVLERVILREPIRRRTLGAATASIGGVVVLPYLASSTALLYGNIVAEIQIEDEREGEGTDTEQELTAG